MNLKANVTSHHWSLHMHPRLRFPPLRRGGQGG